MELFEIQSELKEIEFEINEFTKNLDLDKINEDISLHDYYMQQKDFWNDIEKAKQIILKNNELKAKKNNYLELINLLDDIKIMIELMKDNFDEEIKQEIDETLLKLSEQLESYKINQLLNEDYDRNNAILEIHPGSGGTESDDWGSVLQRMYTRWAEKHNFKINILEYNPGEVVGITSVTLNIEGYNAYGYLKSEKGIHRFIRISPFDSSGRRHTSFVSVNVMPELDKSIELDINESDIKMDVYRASGAGGQHINKTSSAVRLTHIPTGIVVASQQERSQFQNKDIAYKMLESKLYQIEIEKKEKEKEKLIGDKLENGWGSQMRSYVLHPYKMVKDHRSLYETSNVQNVLDGNIDNFINAYLKWKLNK